jgi:L-lactate dehydrogenase complex protein LldG
MPETNHSSVLDDVRRALRRPTTLRPEPLGPFVEPFTAGDMSGLIERFVVEASAVRAQVHRVSEPGQVVEKIIEICGDQTGEVATSGAELLRIIDLREELTAGGISVLIDDYTNHERLVTALANCSVGVTAADYAIAETGTIVLSSEEPRALLVSLLPPVHIAVVGTAQIVPTIDAAIQKTDSETMRATNPTRSTTLITGPSRTSDVELVLSIGVHGPKALHVIIVG